MKKEVLFLICVLSVISFVNAANCGGATACNCGDTLNESWTMTSDLTGCTGDGIKIGANDLILDCAGNSLSGDGGSGDYGIDLLAGGYDNITIKNCNISNFEYGIYFFNSDNGTISNNTLNSNDYGLQLRTSSNNSLMNNTANSNSEAGYLISFSSKNNKLTSNTANLNSQYGIQLLSIASNNTLINNTINSNSWYGVYLTSANNNTLINNTINSNSYGIYLQTSSNNIFTSNILKKNSNIVEFVSGNNFTSNNFLDNLNTLSTLQTDSQEGTTGTQIDFNFTMKYFNTSDCSTCSYVLDLSPSESNLENSSSNSLVIGNFTPTRICIYSLKINITDENNNSEIRKYIYLINATGSDLINYYFRNAYPTHKQPTSYGTNHDAGSLLSEAPTSSENRWCSGYIGFSIDVLPSYLFGVFNEINYSIWYKITAVPRGYTGVQRYGAVNTLVEYNTTIATTSTIFGSFNYTIDWSNDYFWTWYFATVKLVGGSNPYIYSNATDPSYVNITYTYSTTPAIKSISNDDIQLLSATSPSTSTDNATIVLNGNGSTNISIQMLNPDYDYVIKYDGINCSVNDNCTINSNLSGEINLTVTLGSEHNITIEKEIISPSVTFSCSPTAINVGQKITCSCSATDDFDSSPTILYTKNPSTDNTGTYTTTCIASDNSENSASSSISYTVEQGRRIDSSSSSSGSGTIDTFKYSKTIPQTAQEFSEVKKIETSSFSEGGLKVKERVKIKINNEEHHVGVRAITETSATIEINSNPIYVKLDVGEDVKVDVDGDNFYDIYVKLNGIIEGVVDLTIKYIYEAIPEEKIQAGENFETSGEIVEKEVVKEKTVVEPYYFVLGLVGIVLIVLFIKIIIKIRKR